MAGRPHLAFPPRIGSGGHLDTVEQDSDEDILACVYVALKTPIGTRLYVPNFGVSDYTFGFVVPVSELQTEIQTSEPRANTELSQEIDNLIEQVVVGVGNVG
jgi:hypothetical protein